MEAITEEDVCIVMIVQSPGQGAGRSTHCQMCSGVPSGLLLEAVCIGQLRLILEGTDCIPEIGCELILSKTLKLSLIGGSCLGI